MAYFRAIARELASSASEEEDNSNTMKVSLADRVAARRTVEVASEASLAAEIPRMGSREVFKITQGCQRQTIHREHRLVRV